MEHSLSPYEVVLFVGILAAVVVSGNLLLGIVAAVLLRILSVLLDIRNSLSTLSEREVLES
ncbi:MULTISPECIES: hypothetical protein [unclassified Haladaptatus]|uniref:hypothetical protein n=1 Tax=unclassified Haladaptatus TaxID=2622732 RepID=UPI00209C591D|nr:MULTISPECIES: hypothetical protein [unclassified Haladaptatus]MCO8244346.1 hypothetical protein [Haladaptatus sp. AB643]MCO8254031.1 hypothetical protein [Haladaptatus sp. AB618]